MKVVKNFTDKVGYSYDIVNGRTSLSVEASLGDLARYGFKYGDKVKVSLVIEHPVISAAVNTPEALAA